MTAMEVVVVGVSVVRMFGGMAVGVRGVRDVIMGVVVMEKTRGVFFCI
jgi:hypothetical protein